MLTARFPGVEGTPTICFTRAL